MPRLFILLGLLALSPSAMSQWIFGLDLESGGDTLASAGSAVLVQTPNGNTYLVNSTYETLDAGGGARFYGGIRNTFGDGSHSLQYTLGYQFDSLDALNGSAEFHTAPFEFIYLKQAGNWRLGAGLSYHLSPVYSDNLSPGYRREFDDALGGVFMGSYEFYSGLELGARITSIDYQDSISTVDGSSFGLYLQSNF